MPGSGLCVFNLKRSILGSDDMESEQSSNKNNKGDSQECIQDGQKVLQLRGSEQVQGEKRECSA